MKISSRWQAGFEIEVVLGSLGNPRFVDFESDPMDMASPGYCRAVAKMLSRMTSHSWTAPIKPKSKPGYYVLPEYDLDPTFFPEGIVAGVELITPPLPLQEADDLRRRIAVAVDELGGWPNFERDAFTEGIGWHVNLDAGTDQRLDIARFALGADELALLLKGGRYPSGHAAPQRHAYGVPLLRHLQADRGKELGAIGFEHLIYHHGGYGKRYAANFEKLEKGYVELRHFGVDTFLSEAALTDLLLAPIAALQMDHESHALLEERELERFDIVRRWLNDIRSELDHVLGEPNRVGLIRSGTITMAGEPVARTTWNGTMDIALLGQRRLSETAVIYDHQYPDIPEALGVLALDIAEIRAAGLARMPLLCAAFNQAIAGLGRSLKSAGLIAPAPITSGDWWSPLA